ncbi:diacylglycerol kinase catalytic domain (presumed) [delta proteobacterium NaphS2]|nr:diacylglycerol kinase catalytic domain (presumed) [delta proteobacterium NaphS2]
MKNFIIEDNRPHATQGAAGCTIRPAASTGPGIGVISNPSSGGNRKGLQSVERMLAGYHRVLHRRAVDPEQVKVAVRDFARHEVDLVVVNGGDGTIHAVLTALFTTHRPDQAPLLALLRAGTASMIARDVGLPGSRLQGLSRLLGWAYDGRGAASLMKRPVLRLAWEKDVQPMYGMFFGAGGIYEGIQFCLNRIHTKGVGGELAAGLTLARFLLASARGDRRTVPRTSIGVGLEGMEMTTMDVQVILVTTLRRLFLGMRPYWGTEEGPLHFTAIRSDPEHLLRAAPSILRGRGSRWAVPRNGYLSHNLRGLRLHIQSGFTLDGQLYQSNPQLGELWLESGGETGFLKL